MKNLEALIKIRIKARELFSDLEALHETFPAEECSALSLQESKVIDELHEYLARLSGTSRAEICQAITDNDNSPRGKVFRAISESIDARAKQV